MQGGSNMTGTDFCVNKPHMPRSYLNHLVLKDKNINWKYKVIMYKTLIKPVLMYGAETWVLSKVDELRLGVFERKIFKKNL